MQLDLSRLAHRDGIVSDDLIRQTYDQRGSLAKNIDFIKATWRGMQFARSQCRCCCSAPQLFPQAGDKVTWKRDSKALFLFDHGMDATPAVFEPYFAELQKRDDIDICAPQLPHKGNCSREEAINISLSFARDYLLTHPDSKLCQTGHSFGATVACGTEVELRNLSHEVRTTCLAGILNGSTVTEWPGVALVKKPIVIQQNRSGSDNIRALWKKVREDSPALRIYEFRAPADDCLFVPELSSSLPLSGKKETHYLHFGGYGHSAFIASVAKPVIANHLRFVDEKTE